MPLISPEQSWERELVQHAVESKFAEEHRSTVLAELARMRAEFFDPRSSSKCGTEELVRFVVRTQLDAIEQSAGDPSYFSEQRYKHTDPAAPFNRDRLHALDLLIADRQLMAKHVTELIKMLDDAATRMDALSALSRKGDAAGAIPRLRELLKSSDQLECCEVLRTLGRMGPAARDAEAVIVELANDPDHLISRRARAALNAIAPELAKEFRPPRDRAKPSSSQPIPLSGYFDIGLSFLLPFLGLSFALTTLFWFTLRSSAPESSLRSWLIGIFAVCAMVGVVNAVRYARRKSRRKNTI